MCGIAGATTAQLDPRTGEATLCLTRALAHRGPDGEGFWSQNALGSAFRTADEVRAPASTALGHRRLSIVDLEGGAQPMSDPDGLVWVSFNGEIYNHAYLRHELRRLGHQFRTLSDTEVLVHGWKEWGEDLFSRLNGIFAFALVDVPQNLVVLVRDPVGVKPLYLGLCDGLTWWSSEIGAAKTTGLVSESLSPSALKLFLTFRFVPSPYTIYQHTWKIPPGHFVRLTRSTTGRDPQFLRFDSRISSTASPRTRSDWSEALFAELEGAVRRQLMADVPVSSLLSGGVDSSLVTRIMSTHLAEPPKTFGIGFGSDRNESEALVAAAAAQQLRVPHDSTLVRDTDYLAAWPRAIAELGEPIANTGALLVRMICERVCRTHKVTLSGQGADEPLGGYPRHLVERVYSYARYAPALSQSVTRRVFGAENGERLVRALAARSRVDRYVEVFAVIPPGVTDKLVTGDTPATLDLARDAVGRWSDLEQPTDTVNELLRIDARLSLADDLLIIGDLFSMRSGVELRVPFLDLQLLELLERMPSVYKISRLGQRKWLYRRGAIERLPPGLARVLRGHGRFAPKRGFSTPRAWFDDDVLAQDRDLLENAVAQLPLRSGVLDAIAATAGPRQQALLSTLVFWSAGLSTVSPIRAPGSS